MDVAATIAKWPIPSLVATKRAMLHARSADVREARATEDASFVKLVGTPANLEALTAFLEKRDPDFSGIPGA
jgi:enoyl-CoA hydratase/carnithine racemase